MADIKAVHVKNTQRLEGGIVELQTKVEVADVVARVVETRLPVGKQERLEMKAQLLEMRLRLEEQEDKKCRNVVRIKGLSQAQGQEDLIVTLQSLFRRVLEEGDGTVTPSRRY